MPTLLADENIPVTAIAWLRVRGVEVDAMRDRMSGARDAAVLPHSRQHRHRLGWSPSTALW